MDTATRVQILDETDCISHNTNTLGKGMNPIILLPVPEGSLFYSYYTEVYGRALLHSLDYSSLALILNL